MTARSGIDRVGWGEAHGRPVELFTLTNDAGAFIRIITYGAIITELLAPDRSGCLGDIVLGFDTLDEYVDHNPYFGAIVGRAANRIAGGRFVIDGRICQLATNDGANHLHGGVRGFDKVIWRAEAAPTPQGPALRLTYHSPDGEEGYPGAVDATIEYLWTHDHQLKIVMEAVSDAPSPVNLAQHSYFNLDGHDSGGILDHELMIEAEHYLPVGPGFIPSGAFAPVAGTPFDFRQPKPIGRDIGMLPGDGGGDPGGYDINFILRGGAGGSALRRVARVRGPRSGREMEVTSDQPGVQLYTGNFLAGVAGKHGTSYRKHAGLCLETQVFPDAANHQCEPGWPAVILRPGHRYCHVAGYSFAWR